LYTTNIGKCSSLSSTKYRTQRSKGILVATFVSFLS